MTEARRVFVRGVGCISSFGAGWAVTRAALAEGRTAVARVESFDAEGFPSPFGCAVPASALASADDPVVPSRITSAWRAGHDRRIPFARIAAREAWAEAAKAGCEASPERLGVFIGAESGRASLADLVGLSRAAGSRVPMDHRAFGVLARALREAVNVAEVSPAAVASMLSGALGALGPSQTISLACSSGAAAIVEAARTIGRGDCDLALCGGVGADVDPLMLAGFGLLGILSVRGVSCPFDARRDGFVVGEGAAMLVLSSEPGPGCVELAGFARTVDAHHLTAPDPGGGGARRAMRAALEMAGIDSIGYVQAHGTSTPANDPVEAAAIRAVLGDSLAQAKVASVKGALGHWIAGAGALGALCAIEAVRSGTLLPNAAYQTPDANCALPLVLGAAEHREIEAALCNSFAFGGANSALVFRRAA